VPVELAEGACHDLNGEVWRVGSDQNDPLLSTGCGPQKELSLSLGQISFYLEQYPLLASATDQRRDILPCVGRSNVPAALERRVREAGAEIPQERLVERNRGLVAYDPSEPGLRESNPRRLGYDVECIGHQRASFGSRPALSRGVQRE
jgi:hypothetical protein